MNERIRELAGQAGGEFWQRIENDVVNPEAYITFDPPESLEKFAELIVKECADYLDNFNKAIIGDVGIAGFSLKKHFGVKE